MRRGRLGQLHVEGSHVSLASTYLVGCQRVRVLALLWNDAVSSHGGLDDINRVNGTPVQYTTQPSGSDDPRSRQICLLATLVFSHLALHHLKGAQIHRVGWGISDQGSAQPLEGPPDAIGAEGGFHTVEDCGIGRCRTSQQHHRCCPAWTSLMLCMCEHYVHGACM